jgi:hypothetical protein
MPSPSPLAGEGKLSRSDSRERGRRISKLRGRAKEMHLFTNEEGVAEAIFAALRSPPLPNPSPARGEGLNGVTNG